MLSQREPEECLESDVGRTDVLHIVQKLQSEVEVDSLEMLYAAGFRKQLSESTVKEARTALLLHFGFYVYLGPLLHYMDGLNQYGILSMMRKYPATAKELFLYEDKPPMQDISDFFVPSYSSEDHLKAKEVRVVYNFNKFLKQVDREMITCYCLEGICQQKKHQAK